jgi:hypothetical protein
MQNVGLRSWENSWSRHYWCPRCGTLREEYGDNTGCTTNDQEPKLVVRCREFETTLDKRHEGTWKKLGIAESINTGD